MIKKFAVLAALVGLCACHKKNDGPVAGGGTLPGTGSTITKTYTGAIDTMDTKICFRNCKQNVTINADVIKYENDRVTVYLCRNADCANGPVPSVQCSSLVGGDPTPCYTGIPSPPIVLASNAVVFVNAFEKSYSDVAHLIVLDNGYSSYAITTFISR